jgi:hypothetical protein
MADEPNESGGNFDIPTLNLRLGHKKLIGCVSRLLTYVGKRGMPVRKPSRCGMTSQEIVFVVVCCRDPRLI